jgi:hypothetical protein
MWCLIKARNLLVNWVRILELLGFEYLYSSSFQMFNQRRTHKEPNEQEEVTVELVLEYFISSMTLTLSLTE